MFTKRLLGVAVVAAMMGAAGAVNASPSLQIDTSFPTAGLEHTGDAGGSIYPWQGGAGPGAGIPSSTTTPNSWPTGGGIGPDPTFAGNGTSGWHGGYLLLDLNGATSANVTFQFMGAGDSSLRNSFWVDLPAGVGSGGWVQLFQDGQNPPTANGFTNPCPVTPNGATFPSCDKIAPPGVISQNFEYNQYTFAFTAADLFADDGGTYIPFAFDLNNNIGITPGNPGGNPAAGPINAPGVAWGNNNYLDRTGNPDTTYAGPTAPGSPGFFLGADPYLVNQEHVSTNLRAVYAGLTDRPCDGAACDHDFQDMGVRISVVPEPGTLALIGVALCGLVVARRYAARACVPG